MEREEEEGLHIIMEWHILSQFPWHYSPERNRVSSLLAYGRHADAGETLIAFP